MRSALFCALLTGCALLAACGQKGPLYIPSDDQPSHQPVPAPQSKPQPSAEPKTNESL